MTINYYPHVIGVNWLIKFDERVEVDVEKKFMQQTVGKLSEERSIVTKLDIVLRQNKNEYPFIIDTKYKKDPVNADYYQVIAYSLALKKCKACCLIYPESERSEIKKERTCILTLIRDLTGKDPSKVELHARTVDLRLEDSEEIEYDTYIEDIKEQVKKILLSFMNKDT